MGRTCPDLNTKFFFDPDEIQVALRLNDHLSPQEWRLHDVRSSAYAKSAAQIGDAVELCITRYTYCRYNKSGNCSRPTSVGIIEPLKAVLIVCEKP